MGYEKQNYMTSKEVAEFVGLPYKHLWTYQKRGILPQADFHLGNKPVWLTSTLTQWKSARASVDEVVEVQFD